MSLQKGETKTYWLDMSQTRPVDGEYILKYPKSEFEVKIKQFGYFTNGSPLEDLIGIDIKEDTIIIKYHLD